MTFFWRHSVVAYHTLNLCICDRMANRICDIEGRRTSKIIHAVPRLYCESSPADFAALYTAKSGTPLLFRKDGTPYRDPNVLAICTPSPLIRSDVMRDLSFGNITYFSDDPTQFVFCNQFNVQSCLQYLNQVSLSSAIRLKCFAFMTVFRQHCWYIYSSTHCSIFLSVLNVEISGSLV